FSGGSDGGVPRSDLLRASDGFIYGTTTKAGSGLNGTIFRVSPAGAVSTIASFPASPSPNPASGLVEGADGNFYGTTVAGGGFGSVFRVTPSGVLSTQALFDGVKGSAPSAALVLATDGSFYGTASGAGPNGPADGSVFRFTPGASPAL